MDPVLLTQSILIPAGAGVVAGLLPRRYGRVSAGLAVVATATTLALGLSLLDARGAMTFGPALELGPLQTRAAVRVDAFSSWAVAFAAFLGLCTALYALASFRDRGGAPGRFYAWLLLAEAGAATVLLADDLLLLVVGWEVVTLMLYLFAVSGRDSAGEGALRAFAMLGLGDMALLAGVLLVGLVRDGAGAPEPLSVAALAAAPLHTADPAVTAAFLLLLVAAMAKAGAIPFHTWIPSLSTEVDAAVMAFLPGSLDKVLGIFLLVRTSVHWFTPSPLLGTVVMALGAVTLLGAVLLAMVQHDLRRLLSFHAVSQVGYMMLGIGTGTVVGVIGGIFHMVNNAIYKACLFLGAGELERRTGTTDLGALGGLGGTFPVTFGAMFVASMAIAGVPPFNGFVSKWLVYEGCVAAEQPLFLAVALFGSVLTLASFVKVLHSAFWGTRPTALDGACEEPGMGVKPPLVALATLCVLLGTFAAAPMDRFFGPAAGLVASAAITGSAALAGAPEAFAAVAAGGATETVVGRTHGALVPMAVAGLLVFGTLVALFVGYLGNLRTRRTRSVFVGGEPVDRDLNRFPGTEFYETVESAPALRALFRAEKRGHLDLHELTVRLVRPLSRRLAALHAGRVTDYLGWSLAGLALLLFVIVAGR